jgi:UDP:flavonoid glycosyltransferase YjiC (YdhE family)
MTGLVLVSLSSTVMGQEGLLQRAADALGQLPVHALVTTGPAVDPAVIRAPHNGSVRRSARHADVLPYCSAVVTHGGHGTVLKALAAGVPLVIAPLGRDQPDNAARVIALARACESAGPRTSRLCSGRSAGSWTITGTGTRPGTWQRSWPLNATTNWS